MPRQDPTPTKNEVAKLSPRDVVRRLQRTRRSPRLSTGRKIVIRAMCATGMSFREVARREKISDSTVKKIWEDDELEELEPRYIEKTKEALGGRFVLLADRAITKAQEEERLDRMSAFQLAGIAGLSFDKHRVASGLSTENISIRGVVEHLRSEKDAARKIRERLESALRGETAPGI